MNEFNGYVYYITDTSRAREVTVAGDDEIKIEPVKSATFEIRTDGPFPYEHMQRLVGRRVRVTLLD